MNSPTAPHGTLHLAVECAGPLKQFLIENGPLPERVDFWLHHGCVYVDGIRRREDIDLLPGQIVRLHPNPKKYHWDSAPLKNRIIFEDPEFLALDKPAGLPVHPTLDNYLENAKFMLETELGIPIFTTHRLDVPTEGVLLFAKTPAAQALLNKTFAKRRVEKIYFALTDRPVPLGEHILYIDPKSRVPRTTSASPHAGWWECRMEILECETRPTCNCLKIRLITGKTHQIRAQLSALGAPILGDTTYGSLKSYVPERLALECYSLSFTFRSKTLTLVRPNSISKSSPSP